MRVAVQNLPPYLSQEVIRRVLTVAARITKTDHSDRLVEVSFVEDSVMRTANRRYRQIDRVTDILSFTYDSAAARPGEPFGELLIGTDQLQRQAKRKGRRIPDELRDLLIHGYLHLLGHDHHEVKERRVMRAWEDRIRRQLRTPSSRVSA